MLEENIEKLNLKKDIEEILKENNILKIKQLQQQIRIFPQKRYTLLVKQK